jgi:rod shape-determining protein MreC
MMSLGKTDRFWGDFITFVLIFFLSLVPLFFSKNPVENYGLRSLIIEAAGTLTAPFYEIKNLADAFEENRKLRYANMTLQLEKSRYIEAYYENQRLRDLIGFASFQTLSCKPAAVIGSDKSFGIKSILIDVGSEQGVRPNMALGCSQGLVGKIIDVSLFSSVGQLLTDYNFRVAARIQRSRDTGIFHALDDDIGFLDGVHHRADVRPGDTVITTGASSLFPEGLPIGVVTKIDSTESKLFKRVYIKPSVDFSKLEEVFVIMTDSKNK